MSARFKSDAKAAKKPWNPPRVIVGQADDTAKPAYRIEAVFSNSVGPTSSGGTS